MGRIGAVSPLRRFAPALPEGEPRAWWVSIDGGSAKGMASIDGRRESQGLGGCRWTVGKPRVRWVSVDGAINRNLGGKKGGRCAECGEPAPLGVIFYE